ncbi:MAG: hypothetical protein UV51_C0010G0028 [Candidatus Woesebacteria bacterium GW2011_GWC1_42_9]|nr:MAG: hypothetical protein UV51_C0010G0028 [Candidatus Woesebacteria bacterium GW2011_GWC1_42_9]
MSSPFVFKNIIAKPSIKFPFWRINANTSVQFLKALKRLSNSQSDSSSTFGSLTGTSKWYGGVLAPNGMIYGIPINNYGHGINLRKPNRNIEMDRWCLGAKRNDLWDSVQLRNSFKNRPNYGHGINLRKPNRSNEMARWCLGAKRNDLWDSARLRNSFKTFNTTFCK